MKSNSYYPVEVKPLEQYRLLITFDNKERRVFDVAPYLDDIFFAPLRNPSILNSVKINPLSVEWAGGIDMCPDECIAPANLPTNKHRAKAA
ncbi:MAG: DUF2442 domain-containing protein [Clostridiales bacterium]|nr:DUF2442 domain-containing protein [Clostridiales bacterium]